VLKRLFQKIFVAIVPVKDGNDVLIVGTKKNKIVFKERKHFEGTEPNEFCNKFIQNHIEDTPYYYIALLNPDPIQGAFEGCSHNTSTTHVDTSNAKTLCRDKKWMIYTSLKEVGSLKKRYAAVGLDYLFSPFSIIEMFFKDKIGGHLAMYVLAQPASMSVAFFEEGKLDYAHHYQLYGSVVQEEIASIEELPMSFEEEREEEPSGINLDDIESLDDLDIIDDLDDLGNIEDLDNLDDISDFHEDDSFLEPEEIVQPKEKTAHRFSDEYKRFELVQKALVKMYESEHCKNRFVETVYIADAFGSTGELKQYLEDELFLSVMSRKIDLCEEVVKLCEIEEGNG